MTQGAKNIVKVVQRFDDDEGRGVGEGEAAAVYRMTGEALEALRGDGGGGGVVVVTTLDLPLASTRRGATAAVARRHHHPRTTGSGVVAATRYQADPVRAAWAGGLRFSTRAAARILRVPNAGGDSVLSEAMSAEMLLTAVWREAGMGKDGTMVAGTGRLAATEMEVRYFPHGGSMLDYVLEVCDDGMGTSRMVGVSVTRAFAAHPPGGSGAGPRKLGVEEVTKLLRKKLRGIRFAARNACLAGQRGLDVLVLHAFVPDGHTARLSEFDKV
ncbi:hypothetical protein HDU96_004555 [Phlyctochytrium bullatum]|nr:hypothetical protein HDU96_004555 [Phlyctochytrium bullatum]